MSLWLEAATEALADGEYERFRKHILPKAPIPLPACLIRELEFAERRCRDNAKDRLFPIRFLWSMEANEQRLFGYPALGRSSYHPEKLLEVWSRASTDANYRRALEDDGFRFDLAEKAIELTVGWVYIGDRFFEDLLEVEAALGVELLFTDPSSGEPRPAFQELKQQRSQGGSSSKEKEPAGEKRPPVKQNGGKKRSDRDRADSS